MEPLPSSCLQSTKEGKHVNANLSTRQMVNPPEYRGMTTSPDKVRESFTQEASVEPSLEDQIGIQIMWPRIIHLGSFRVEARTARATLKISIGP